MKVVPCGFTNPSQSLSRNSLMLVKKYFLTLSKYRKFVIANRDRLKQAIKEKVSLHLKITGEAIDPIHIQRDCLVLRQIAIDI